MLLNSEIKELEKLDSEQQLLIDFSLSDDCSPRQFEYCKNRLNDIDAYKDYLINKAYF